jgi:hypothetical protein
VDCLALGCDSGLDARADPCLTNCQFPLSAKNIKGNRSDPVGARLCRLTMCGRRATGNSGRQALPHVRPPASRASVCPHHPQHIRTIALELALADAADLRKGIRAGRPLAGALNMTRPGFNATAYIFQMKNRFSADYKDRQEQALDLSDPASLSTIKH